MANFTSIHSNKKISLFLSTAFIFLLSFYLKTHLYPCNSNFLYHSESLASTVVHSRFLHEMNGHDCNDLHEYTDYASKCLYLKSQISCRPKGFINYLHIFYCVCGQFPLLGYTVLLLWLVLLFYLLGNTAANYFCYSLDGLSRILKLSPTIAGITLLSLGNGAPDVFASIVSFTRSRNSGVGINSVLGGAFFVSSAVVGILSVLISSHQIQVDRHSFIRDILFFLFSLSSLLVILVVGKISLSGAISFVSIYFVYVCVVSATHFLHGNQEKAVNQYAVSPASRSSFMNGHNEFSDTTIPLLGYVDEDKVILAEKGGYKDFDEKQKMGLLNFDSSTFYYLGRFLFVLELPLYLPRRLTIPVVSEEQWSKPFAVISVTLAPVLLAIIWNSHGDSMSYRASLVNYLIAGFVGIVLGNLAFVTTKRSSPPKKCLFPWLAGAFLMSVTWTYIIAEELVSLLVSFGTIVGISPSFLGLTVLAWGNSLGDLIANVAMAMNGGPDGVQIAISGCYAGPMFNTLVGLGLSLVFSSWSEYPSSFVIPRDTSLYETVAFLMSGLLLALVILPKKHMRLDRFLGGGLLGIYSSFLFLRVVDALGLLKLHGSSSLKS